MERQLDDAVAEATAAPAADTVLGFEKHGPTRKAAEVAWRNFLNLWRREATDQAISATGPRK